MGILCVFLLCPILYDLVFYAFSKWLVEDLSLQITWETMSELLLALPWAIITLI
jgi:hypothetical protein